MTPVPSVNESLNLTHRGRRIIIEKRVVHQWRTDILLSVDGRQFLIGRLDGGMTRGEVRTLAQAWLENHSGKGGR